MAELASGNGRQAIVVREADVPLFDVNTLDTEIDGGALLASVLYATPEARAEAMERGRLRLARSFTAAGSTADANGRQGRSVKSAATPRAKRAVRTARVA